RRVDDHRAGVLLVEQVPDAQARAEPPGAELAVDARAPPKHDEAGGAFGVGVVHLDAAVPSRRERRREAARGVTPGEFGIDGVARHPGQAVARERLAGEAGVAPEAGIEPGPGEHRIERADAGIDAELHPLPARAV